MVKNFLQLLPKDYITPPLTEEAGRKEGEFFSKMSFIVNLFGTGIRYWVCDLLFEEYLEMLAIKEKHNVEWEQLLFDFDFLKHFGYKHWSEMSSQKEYTGFLLTNQNRIEIKQKTKFITRFRADALLNQDTLFPLYKTSWQTSENPVIFSAKRIILIQFEKGLIGKSILDINIINIENIEFHLTTMNDLGILSTIQYESRLLKNSSQDSLVIGVQVVM